MIEGRRQKIYYFFKKATYQYDMSSLRQLLEEAVEEQSDELSSPIDFEALTENLLRRSDSLKRFNFEALNKSVFESINDSSGFDFDKLMRDLQLGQNTQSASTQDRSDTNSSSEGSNLTFEGWMSPGASTGGGTNFDTIGDGLNNYRCAQPPKSEDFYRFLNQKYKINNIISLNHKNHNAEAEAAGLSYLHVPLGSRPPSNSNWEQIKSLLRRGNCLVHCTHGADRTGAVVARWKIEEYNESCDSAYQEALTYGFKPQSHPGYGKGPDPNKDLRTFIEAPCR